MFSPVHMRDRLMICLLSLLILPNTSTAQSISDEAVRNLILAFKQDERGPYQAIRWFCPDGTTRAANQPCSEPGGIQHALHKGLVLTLAKERGIYLGQILAGTNVGEFIDANNQNNRMKQYQMEKYLQRMDNGWILRRARFYRGAVQAEDEDAWGMQFLNTLVQDNAFITDQFFLLRQISKDIPHRASDNTWERIRADAKTIADSLPSFMPMRIKLHGQPDKEDVQRLDDFLSRNRSAIGLPVANRIRTLRDELKTAYGLASVQSLTHHTMKLPVQLPVTTQLKQFMEDENALSPAMQMQRDAVRNRCEVITEILFTIRSTMLDASDPAVRLTLIDLSNDPERLLFTEISLWQSETLSDLLARQHVLTKAAVGCGFLELWEWDYIDPILRPTSSDDITVEQLVQKAEYGRRAVEWSTNMVRAEYHPVIALFQGFEPQAVGFLDDRIRASVVLRLGETAGILTDIAKQTSGVSNKVLTISNPNQIRGLNPGFAVGELEVITGSPERVIFHPDKIYVLENAPADMKPVAGILTVASGNLVSHVQLLARNLGIPNADILQTQIQEFSVFKNQRVFFAVSPHGSVVMKPEGEMTQEDRLLVEVKARSEEKITVPIRNINTQQRLLSSLDEIRASDSGRLCGPKAANAGQLKRLFPDHVVDGIVLTFGVFRQHMDQLMPGQTVSYWSFVQQTFQQANQARSRGISEEDIDLAVLNRLSQLREAIKTMPLLESFRTRLRNRFIMEFGVEMGYVSAFIRSDTNMEDLKDFTGAGLNLTVFNVRDPGRILQAIRDVWASPYTERSYRWRQKYLLNPEDVYPSVLIMPTVPVDKSGVMITSGVSNGDQRDITVAFSRGPGGAVDGQSTETYLLRHTGESLLLSPSRETMYNILPSEGGVGKGYTRFSQPILTEGEKAQLRTLAENIREQLPLSPGIETDGPFDVELGFRDGKLWLFQVRPYVENKRAKSSEYLRSLDSQVSNTDEVSLRDPLKQ